MKYHNITKDDMLNGDGLRTVLWVSGCNHHCPGCQNPMTWDHNDGLVFDDAAKKEIFEQLDQDYIAGVTLSGGEPLHPANYEEIKQLIDEIKEHYPNKTVWLYTGDVWENIMNDPIVQKIDVLVDGEFILAQNDNNLMWKGSSNQRVIDVQKTLQQEDISKPVLHCGDYDQDNYLSGGGSNQEQVRDMKRENARLQCEKRRHCR